MLMKNMNRETMEGTNGSAKACRKSIKKNIRRAIREKTVRCKLQTGENKTIKKTTETTTKKMEASETITKKKITRVTRRRKTSPTSTYPSGINPSRSHPSQEQEAEALATLAEEATRKVIRWIRRNTIIKIPKETGTTAKLSTRKVMKTGGESRKTTREGNQSRREN